MYKQDLFCSHRNHKCNQTWTNCLWFLFTRRRIGGWGSARVVVENMYVCDATSVGLVLVQLSQQGGSTGLQLGVAPHTSGSNPMIKLMKKTFKKITYFLVVMVLFICVETLIEYRTLLAKMLSFFIFSNEKNVKMSFLKSNFFDS